MLVCFRNISYSPEVAMCRLQHRGYSCNHRPLFKASQSAACLMDRPLLASPRQKHDLVVVKLRPILGMLLYFLPATFTVQSSAHRLKALHIRPSVKRQSFRATRLRLQQVGNAKPFVIRFASSICTMQVCTCHLFYHPVIQSAA